MRWRTKNDKYEVCYQNIPPLSPSPFAMAVPSHQLHSLLKAAASLCRVTGPSTQHTLLQFEKVSQEKMGEWANTRKEGQVETNQNYFRPALCLNSHLERTVLAYSLLLLSIGFPSLSLHDCLLPAAVGVTKYNLIDAWESALTSWVYSQDHVHKGLLRNDIKCYPKFSRLLQLSNDSFNQN